MKHQSIKIDRGNHLSHLVDGQSINSKGRAVGIIAVIILAFCFSGCNSNPRINQTSWVAAFILVAIVITVVAVLIHKHEMRRVMADKQKSVENLRAQAAAQDAILEELRRSNVLLVTLVTSVDGNLSAIRESPYSKVQKSEIRSLAYFQTAMVQELQLTYQLKKALAIALGCRADDIPDLPPYEANLDLALAAREIDAQQAIADTLKLLTELDRRIFSGPRLQRLKTKGHQ
jgi:hypothetical protein